MCRLHEQDSPDLLQDNNGWRCLPNSELVVFKRLATYPPMLSNIECRAMTLSFRLSVGRSATHLGDVLRRRSGLRHQPLHHHNLKEVGEKVKLVLVGQILRVQNNNFIFKTLTKIGFHEQNLHWISFWRSKPRLWGGFSLETQPLNLISERQFHRELEADSIVLWRN